MWWHSLLWYDLTFDMISVLYFDVIIHKLTYSYLYYSLKFLKWILQHVPKIVVNPLNWGIYADFKMASISANAILVTFGHYFENSPMSGLCSICSIPWKAQKYLFEHSIISTLLLWGKNWLWGAVNHTASGPFS